jgi:broad specificity phosphatase PhoE
MGVGYADCPQRARGYSTGREGIGKMTTQAITKETAEEAKARKNAEYEAKLDKSFRELERGEVVSMTFEEWGKKIREWIA